MVQWYPGHMAKAFREMDEKIKFVDLVIVLLDARVQESSFNPEVAKKFQNKQVLYILTKADKADNVETKKWCKYYNLPYRRKDIKLYTDKEWEII